ncbi:MAG: lamin tail domain-containing protein, partial [Candidatus Komeilibacteria bacterium]
VTPFGISEKYKQQVKDELSNTLVVAMQTSAFAKEKTNPSLTDKLYSQLEKLKNEVIALVSRVNPFKAGVALNLPENQTEILEVPPPTFLPQEVDLVEQDVLREIIKPEPEIEQLIATTTAPELSASTTEPMPLPEPVIEPLSVPASEPAPILGPVFCERDSGNPTRFRVLINEVAWMGTSNSSNDEWIELKNVWGIPVKLSGWQFLDKARQIKVIFDEDDIIPAGGYYLLERTDDNSMPDAKADLIYTGALSNADEALYLFDDQCNIEDEVLANPNWPSGDNILKKPMARLDVLNWYAGVSTPGKENSSPPIIRSSVVALAPVPAVSSVSPQIFITETYIGSVGNQKDDFVELYNPNQEAINLTDYYIQRKTENVQDFSTYISHELLIGKTIEARSYFLIVNASSTFASSADVITTNPLTKNNTLALKDPKQEIIDQASTSDPPASKSYGRKWSSTTLNYTEDFENQIPTPRSQNQNSEPVEEKKAGENNLLSVVINEIAWAGTEANHFDEWLELLVNSTTSFDGWKILGSKNGTTTLEIPLSGFASSSSYILVERTDENTILDISAGFFFTGSLDNNGMKLEIYDSNNTLIDVVDCSAGWFAGDNSTKQSMERIDPLAGSDLANWASNNLVSKNSLDVKGNIINGTPKAENSVAKSSTELIGGLNITENFTLTLLGSPYLVEGSITVGAGAKLTIEPGVTIKFKHHYAWKSELKVEGELMAIGTETQKITFTSSSTQPAAGDWEWLYFQNASSTLKNVVIQYAGKKEGNPPFSPSFTMGAIYVKGGHVEIENSIIEKSQTLGLWILDSADVLVERTEFLDADGDWEKAAAVFVENGKATIKNSTFKNNKIGVLLERGDDSVFESNVFEENEIPIRTATLLPKFSGNTAQNNNINGITMTGFGFSDSVNQIDWQPDDLPYIIENSATIPSGKTLNIKSGAIIKFKNIGCIYVEGILHAEGAKDQEIVFTSLSDDEYGGDTNNDGAATSPGAGSWDSMYFYASSTNSVLDNVIVRYGGWYNTFWGGANAKGGAVKVDNTVLTIKNSVFENNAYGGLELIHSDSEIQDTIFRGHSADYFWGQRSAGLILENSAPALKKVNFNNNYYGIYISGDCPDLSDVIFGEGENANSIKVGPIDCGL